MSANGATVSGDARVVAPDVQHPNGNIYDQVLMTGASATMRADPGQILRVSFLDATDDIVQVEFSGAGELHVVLHNASAPMAPAKYNQPGVEYVRGHASLAIHGSNATSNISTFSVGPGTPGVNPTLFPDGMVYDGIADLALLTIAANPDTAAGAAFGGIRMGNAHFSARSGDTGIHAPGVQVQNVVRIGDVTAFEDAMPRLWFGSNSTFQTVEVTGGDLVQPNGRLIQAGYCFTIVGLSGTRSDGSIFAPENPPKPSVISCYAGP